MDEELQSSLEAFSLDQEDDDLQSSLEAFSQEQEDEEVVEETSSGELDLDGLQSRRNNGESDDTILNDIVDQAGTKFTMNGQPFDLAPAMGNTTSSALLDFIMSGDVVDNSITKTGASLKGIGNASLNLLGLPVDLVSAVLTSGESLVRSGANAVASINAPEGVDDPNSPNYDPDFYLSTDSKDFIVGGNPAPFGGSQNLKDMGNAVGDAVGVESKVYPSKENIPPENRAYFEVSRVITENAIPAAGILKAAKLGIGLNNPLVKEAATNPTKFKNIESAATGTAAALVGFTETIGLGDNPWAMMGAEFLGSLIGGNAASTASKVGTASDAVGKSIENLIAGFSKTAANKGAVNDILVAAKSQREMLLDRANTAQSAGDTALYERLIDEADAHTPERIMQDLETSLALGEASPIEGVNLPAGNLTENPLLLSLQKALEKDASFSGDVTSELSTALNQILQTSERLARAGNTAAADTLKARYFQNLLDTRIHAAQTEATNRVNTIGSNISQQEASNIAQSTLFEAKDNIRAMETYLWDRVDTSIPLGGSKLADSIDSINSKIMDGETIAGGGQLDAVIQNFYTKLRDPNATVNVGEVRKFRTRMLDEARTLASGSNPDFFKAGIFDALANAAVEELNTIPLNMGGAEIKDARKFSANMNQRFTRYFNKQLLSTEAKGGTSIRSEQTLEKAMAGSETDRALNMAEMRDAAEFTDEAGVAVEKVMTLDEARNAAQKAELDARIIEGDGSVSNAGLATNENIIYPENTAYPDLDDGVTIFPPEGSKAQKDLDQMFNRPDGDTYSGTNNVEAEDDFVLRGEEEVRPEDVKALDVPRKIYSLGDRMSSAQEDFLRGAVSKLKGTDNTIPTDKLEEFMSATGNAEVLKAFPNFKTELTGLLDAQKYAVDIASKFSSIAETGKLPDAVGDVINSKNPVDNYVTLANEALGDVDALADLRMATIDKLFETTRTNGDPDFFKLTTELTRPLSGRSGDQSILDVMQQQGVISKEETEAVGNLIAEGLRIQRSTMTTKQLKDTVQETSGLVNNAARIFGANFGSMFGVGEGSQLQSAAIMSAAAKNLVSGLPVGNKLESMKTIMLQPRTLLQLMEANPAIRKGILDGVKEFFVNYGADFKGLSKGQATFKVLKDITAGSVKATGSSIASTASKAPISSSSAFSESLVEDEQPTVAVDQQMMDLSLQ
jgi:hypothetical protein